MPSARKTRQEFQTQANRPITPHVRWMVRSDLPDVLEIERDSFAFYWTEEHFFTALRRRNCIGMVAEQAVGGSKSEGQWRRVGFMVYELERDKLVIANFAVRPGFRRFGIGRSMIAKLVGKLSSHRRRSIAVHVRESNLGAHLFFKMTGFQALRVIRDHYEDSGEDAYLMEYRIRE